MPPSGSRSTRPVDGRQAEAYTSVNRCPTERAPPRQGQRPAGGEPVQKMTERLPASRLRIDPRIYDGYYSDVYFNRARDILLGLGRRPKVALQFFQKHDNTVLCGIEEALAILEGASRSDELKVFALNDGSKVDAYETVMVIFGDYTLFGYLETVLLGAMAESTVVATNVRQAVEAAAPKPVLFFPARFGRWTRQTADGYAAWKSGALAASTEPAAEWWGSPAVGTVPHALIAALGGDTVAATIAFARKFPDIPCISLVDFDNDCVNTSLKVARAMRAEGLTLWGVRLDTSATMVDRSLMDQMGQFPPTGVNPVLVRNVRRALDEAGFSDVKIVVSGGFDAERIRRFEEQGVPADVYAVGSSLLKGERDFTADVVLLESGPGDPVDFSIEGWNFRHCSKVGRRFKWNDRLLRVW